MAQRIKEEFSVIVPLVLTVENQGHNVAPNFPGKAAQAGKQFRISLVQIAPKINRSLGERARLVGLAGQKSRPKLLHVLVRNYPGLVEKVSNPVSVADWTSRQGVEGPFE